jgi:ABC-type nickel/cobalt efflux system permease component RcnA
MTALLPALLGVALGMRHALEPDHLAAVSTLASEHKSASAGVVVGAMWGVGHSVSLFVVGGTLALLEAQMPARVEQTLELLVALMIFGLGVRAIRQAIREGRTGVPHAHRHGELVHTHPAPPAHLHLQRWTFSTRPLLVGVLHGLAGSGALTALVLAELPTAADRLAYIGLFGAGSVLGMGALTGLAGVPLSRAARQPRLAAAVLATAGVVSLVVGTWWGVASVGRLLTS